MKFYGQAYVTHLEAEIAWLRRQLEVEQAKVSRMEMAIMPLSSAAGRAYTEAVNPSLKANPVKVDDVPKSWRQIQADAYKEIENDNAIRKEESGQSSATGPAKN